MPEYLHIPPVAQAVLTITGIVLAVVRLLTASKAFWWYLPAWVQKGVPALLVALGTLPKALEMAKSWLDIAVALVFAVGAWFTASRGDQRPVEPPKKKPPEDTDTTVSIMPEPVKLVAQDRSRLHNDIPDEPAEFRGMWSVFAATGLLIAFSLCALAVPLLGCAAVEKRLPCDESKLRAIDAEYSAKVIAVCLPRYDSKESCPEWPALQVEHRRQLKEACP
jgi:hypothetical protein